MRQDSKSFYKFSTSTYKEFRNACIRKSLYVGAFPVFATIESMAGRLVDSDSRTQSGISIFHSPVSKSS